MRNTTLMRHALGMTPPWKVQRSDFDPEIHLLAIDFASGSRLAYPYCGETNCRTYDAELSARGHFHPFPAPSLSDCLRAADTPRKVRSQEDHRSVGTSAAGDGFGDADQGSGPYDALRNLCGPDPAPDTLHPGLPARVPGQQGRLPDRRAWPCPPAIRDRGRSMAGWRQSPARGWFCRHAAARALPMLARCRLFHSDAISRGASTVCQFPRLTPELQGKLV